MLTGTKLPVPNQTKRHVLERVGKVSPVWIWCDEKRCQRTHDREVFLLGFLNPELRCVVCASMFILLEKVTFVVELVERGGFRGWYRSRHCHGTAVGVRAANQYGAGRCR